MLNGKRENNGKEEKLQSEKLLNFSLSPNIRFIKSRK
jgi:hypothetical protein